MKLKIPAYMEEHNQVGGAVCSWTGAKPLILSNLPRRN